MAETRFSPASGSHEEKVSTGLQKLCAGALQIARAHESGQAHLPLCQSFEKLQDGFHGDPVHAILLGLSPEDTAEAVSALVGEEYNICRIIVPSHIGYTVVLLQERGFTLETGTERLEFDQLEPFVQALEREDLVQEGNPASWMDPLRLHLPAPSRRRGLRLLVPESVDALVKKPALLSTLADQADWLFLAGKPGMEISSEARDTLQLLINRMVGLQCLICGKDGDKTLPSAGWWMGWKVVCSLSPLPLGLGAAAVDTRLALLSQPESELRRFIQETRRQRRLEESVELLLSEIEQSRQHLGSQRKLQNAGLIAGTGQDPKLRRAVDQAKERLLEDIEAIRRSLDDESKRQLVPGGSAYEAVEKAVQSIETGDINHTVAGEMIRLSLDDQCRHTLIQAVEAITRSRLSRDLGLIQESMDTASEQMRVTLRESADLVFRPSFAALDEQRIWSGMLGLARPEIRYRGEMPKPSIGSRLGKARQSIFGILIVGMILGAVGSLLGEQMNIRNYLYAALLPLMVLGFFYTYISFRKQQNQILDKELEKLREGAARELRRVVSELFREEHNVISQHLQKSTRTTLNALAEEVTRHETRRQADREAAQRQARDQERSIEQRLKILDDRRRDAGNLTRQLEPLKTGLDAWLKDWVVRFNTRKA